MGLSLNAEQKTVVKIFRIEEQYIIPSYQRPYSWEYDQCFQLYNDLQSAYEENEDYFIGNIVIAKGENNRGKLEVVDGQQRLITLLLLLKVLHIKQPSISTLKQLLEKEDWEGNNVEPRIVSEIFETNDGEALAAVLRYDALRIADEYHKKIEKNGRINERMCRNRFEANILHFYNWITYLSEQSNDLNGFTKYLVEQVSLLPIELSGKTQEEANKKALVIFETINNRGMNLEDADIFKAKLYNKAKSVKEENVFIELWTEFKTNTDSLGLEIDDIFRYYSHIIRGKLGITSSETNLRDFFTNQSSSPFELKQYRDILNDLLKIIEILVILDEKKKANSTLAKWLQIIDMYTNIYPKYAIVNFLFVNDLYIDNDDFIEFLKSIVRYIYYQGSTTTIKFEIYNIIKQTASNKKISTYHKESISQEYFDYLGRLKKGYALLAYYLSNEYALSIFDIDKIINVRDFEELSSQWKDVELNEYVEKLGNFLVLDIPKKNTKFTKKLEYYEGSNLSEVKLILNKLPILPSDIDNRDIELKTRLVDFFKL